MKMLKQVVYMTADEIDALVAERQTEADALPAGMAKQSALKDVASWRAYEAMKRMMAPQATAASKKSLQLSQ